MLDFLRKNTRSTGSVLFRGAIPPRLENFYFLKDLGVELTPESACEESVWAARTRHPQWGEAMLICPRQFQMPPRSLLEFDPRLTKAEVDSILTCGSGVTMGMIQERQNVLRERKLALRMLHAIMGQEGLAIADHASQRFWSPAAAAEEVAHDADLDIESLYSLHAVSANNEKNAPVQWLHSHGLAELGYFDFDILQPSPGVFPSGILRALAYGIVECRIEGNSNYIAIAQPQGALRMIPADTFRRRAAARFANLRDGRDGDHSANRSVVCEPKKWPWSWLGGGTIEPCRWLQGDLPDDFVVYFSKDATNLMSQRARDSYGMCRRYVEEFAEFQVKALVKLGLPVDNAADDREHLWFEPISLGAEQITGTLLNEPWHIAGLKSGESYTYGIDVLSDWVIYTPAGPITPVEFVAVRNLRANRNEILEAMRAQDHPM